MNQQQKNCVLKLSIMMAVTAFVSAYAMYQYLYHFIHVLLVNWWKPYITLYLRSTSVFIFFTVLNSIAMLLMSMFLLLINR